MDATMLFTEGILFIIIYVIELCINIFIFWFIIKSIKKLIKKATTHNFFKNNVVNSTNLTNSDNRKAIKYTDITNDKLSEFNTDNLEAFKDFFYKIFLNFENAYNNLDFNMMKKITTKQLYQNYYTGITLDLESGNKRIIDDIKKEKVIIFETFTSISKQVVSAMIEISYITYVINKNGYISKGSRSTRITEKFEVTFRKDFEKQDVKKCPNCGANVVGNKCEFCRTVIKNVEFKISNIKKIIE